MDVREKLVELLLQEDDLCERGECKDCFANGSCYYYRVTDRLIAHGVTVQEWVSTGEKMPTEDDATDGYVSVVYSCGDGAKIKTISLVDAVIAHPDLYDYWMSLNLPQPPKGE